MIQTTLHLTIMIKKSTSFYIIILFAFNILFSSCDAAKVILREAAKLDKIEEEKEEEEAEKKEAEKAPDKKNEPVAETPKVPEPPKKKEERKVRDVPISGKIDPDGLPVSSNPAMKELEEKTFPLFFNVDNDVTVRHRGLTKAQIDELKKQIIEAKSEFFETFSLEKNEPNAADDNTKGVIIDVFDTDKLYQEMFPKLFDTKAYKDPDINAGMCFENNPSFEGNIIRIALKIFKYEDGTNDIANAKHEFVHYLDMRYNWASVGFEPNDWWMEGLAEYFGNPDSEEDHIKVIKKRKFTLKKIMGSDNHDNSNELVSD